ncbi:MAG: T9SS type A sorting domain-containing protein, partial [Bacteroidia bacterium]|nr:T9SS type A sorting domain-containing protein [Bacteroidia bacterium]
TLCGEGYLSQNSKSEIIGLGSNTTVDYVKVNWLSGTEDILNNVSANQVLTIVEGSETLGLSDLPENNIRIYPNPVADVLNIESSKAILSVSIFNILGQPLRQITHNDISLRLNVSELSAGSYIVQISTYDGMKSYKLIKD